MIAATGRDNVVSVHLAEFPKYQEEMIDKELESRMQMAQDVTSVSYTHLILTVAMWVGLVSRYRS